MIATRFVAHLSQREAIDCLTYQLPSVPDDLAEVRGEEPPAETTDPGLDESAPLLRRSTRENISRTVSRSDIGMGLDGSTTPTINQDELEIDLAESLEGLSALEIAAVSGAKKFLSQKPIQRIITAIW